MLKLVFALTGECRTWVTAEIGRSIILIIVLMLSNGFFDITFVVFSLSFALARSIK